MPEATMISQEAPTPPLPIRKEGYLAAKCNVKAASACEGKQRTGVTLAVHKKASKSSVGTVKTSKQKSAKHGIKKVTKPASKQPAQPTVSERPAANSEAALADGPCSEPKDTAKLPAAEADQSQDTDLGAAQPPANATGTVIPCTQAKYASPIMQHQAPPAQPSPQQNSPAPADFTQAGLPPITQPQAAQSLALTEDPVHVAVRKEADAGLAQPSELAEDILLPTAASKQSQVALGKRIWPCSRHVVVFAFSWLL